MVIIINNQYVHSDRQHIDIIEIKHFVYFIGVNKNSNEIK